MSRKKVWNSIMRRKKKNHLDLSSKDENSPTGNVCKFVWKSRAYLVSLERNLHQRSLNRSDNEQLRRTDKFEMQNIEVLSILYVITKIPL